MDASDPHRAGRPAPLRLFCFPASGGSSSDFDGWSDELPAPIVVVPLGLPGRGEHAEEQPQVRVGPLVELLTSEIVPHLRNPYALFGHSLGALIAFEVARALRRAGAPPPVAVYAAGLAAPHLGRAGPPIHSAPDDIFVRELRRHTDSRWDALDDPQRRPLLLPLLRADVEQFETYEHVADEPLTCPLRAFGGGQDKSVRPTELAAWRQHTTGPFRLEMFAGDHSFPVTDRDQMLHVLRSDLLHLLRGGGVTNLGEQGSRDLAYWTAQLADVGVLDLPTDNRRLPSGGYRPAELDLEVPESVTDALAGFCEQSHQSLFVPLMAAFAILVARYGDQDDLVIGVPTISRDETDWLPLRVNVGADVSVRDLLDHVAAVVHAAREHRGLTFERLVHELGQRDPTRHPLFQVAFHLADGLDGLDGLDALAPGARGPLDLDLRLTSDGVSLRGRLTYDANLYGAPTAACLVGSYLAVLDGITADGGATVSSVPLLSAEDRHRVLATWNGTTVVDDPEEDLISCFEGVVARCPAATAFTDGTSTLTFAELRLHANRLAHRLAALGVGPEVPVGVCVDRSCDIPVILLAVWKAGGAWLPLDPTYPAERLRFMMEDAGAEVLVTNSTLARLFPDDGARRTVFLDLDSHLISRHPATDPGGRPRADDLASITYTSGSTGRAKGVAIEHRQILNRLSWMWGAYPFDPGEVGAQNMSTSFVDAMWELLGPLLRGIPTVIVPVEQTRDLTDLVDKLATARATRLWLVPSLLRALLDTHADLSDRLPRLRFWVSTGEILPLDLYERFQRVMPHATLYNLYGTTEVWDATWYDPRTDGAPRWRVPIGRPIRNVQAYVLDRQLQPVPPGVEGELYIGGKGLARGYLGLPDLTAERFLPHPFDSASEARIYRTGDRARHLPDGVLDLLGRRDDQLNLRGFRIEPKEVEALLRNHPSIREAAVTGQATPSGDIRLVAYVVARSNPGPPGQELREHLAHRLPPYSVPSAFVPLDSLPLTPSGKIDYGRLPAGPAIPGSAASSYVAPQSPVEVAVAGVWREVLHEGRIGMHDDFFALGGNSILAARIVAELRKAFRVDLPSRRFFETPTVAGLATALIEDPRTRPDVYLTAERLNQQPERVP